MDHEKGNRKSGRSPCCIPRSAKECKGTFFSSKWRTRKQIKVRRKKKTKEKKTKQNKQIQTSQQSFVICKNCKGAFIDLEDGICSTCLRGTKLKRHPPADAAQKRRKINATTAIEIVESEENLEAERAMPWGGGNGDEFFNFR